MKKILLMIMLLIALGGGAYFIFKSNADHQKYRTEKLTRGDIEAAVTATGTVNAVKTVL